MNTYNRDMMLIRMEHRARRLTAIDEVCHYYKTGGKERAFKFYMAFFDGDLTFEEERNLIKGIWTDDIAMIENACKDINRTAWKTIRDVRGRIRGN